MGNAFRIRFARVISCHARSFWALGVKVQQESHHTTRDMDRTILYSRHLGRSL